MATKPTRIKNKKNGKTAALENVTDYRHEKAKRKNNPPAKIAAEGTVQLRFRSAHECWKAASFQEEFLRGLDL